MVLSPDLTEEETGPRRGAMCSRPHGSRVANLFENPDGTTSSDVSEKCLGFSKHSVAFVLKIMKSFLGLRGEKILIQVTALKDSRFIMLEK